MLSISHCQAKAYHPEANGAVERMHSHLKEALRARATRATRTDEIPRVLLGLRSQPREETGLSPAEGVSAVPLGLPNEFWQVEEFSVDQIANKFFKIINPPAFSLPSKHYLGQQLPNEHPADLLLTALIWVCRV